MTPTRPLEGRVALVTGANHGIGAAVATALAGRGAAVLVNYLRLAPLADPGLPEAYDRQRADDAGTVLARIAAAGGRAAAVEADLADEATIARLFDEAQARFGPVDILVNNASGWAADTFAAAGADRVGRRLPRVSAGTVDRNLAVDARAAALLMAELAHRHQQRGATWGRIVGLTSGGADGFPEEVSYGAAKAAMESFTLSAASELADVGITANVVHPPVTDTGWVTDAVRAAVAASPDLVHVADPAEVAEIVAWLCTDDARLVTGSVLRLR